jgi:DNA-binding MarR family transcriptional regulator
VNISSTIKETTYPTPEFRNIIESLTKLKVEVARFRHQISDQISYNKLLKNIDTLEESIFSHYLELNNVEKLFMMASTLKLTQKQKKILRWLVEHYNKKSVYTVLIQKLSKELNIPQSTVRWNLKGLRDADLIEAGDKDNKGIPVSLTPIGRIMADYAIVMDD